MNLNNLLGNNPRTSKANKNILISLGIKGVDCIVQLLLIPITLDYLNAYEYGLWLTLNSILLWINTFDIGMGNGFRNQLAIAVANEDIMLAKSLVSTSFAMIAMIMIAILLIVSPIVLNLNWYNILGADPNSVENLKDIVYISFVLFCINFMVKFIGNVYLAMQMPSINNLLVSLGHLLSLIIIFILTKTTNGSLFNIAVTFSLSPVIIYIIAYPITFNMIYKDFKPTLFMFQKKYIRKLFNTGFLFFLLQICGIILFAMSNIIISRMFGPEKVTPYNIAFRYFSLINLFASILISPMWSAVTEAYAKKEMDWISKSIRSVEKRMYLLGGAIIIMVIISDYIYKAWIDSKVEIPSLMSFMMALYVYIIAFSTSYSYFLNGMSKLRIQFVNIAAMTILYLPLCYYFGKLLGIYGILLSMILLNIPGLIINKIQLKKIIGNNAIGIWNK